jgi:hypothetical protein
MYVAGETVALAVPKTPLPIKWVATGPYASVSTFTIETLNWFTPS